SVPNNSFEVPALSAGAFQYNPSGGSWSFINSSGIANNGSAFNNANAPDGVQVGILQNTGTISQNVNFPIGGPATISFLSAFRNSQDGVNDFSVFIDTTLVGTFTPGTSATYTAFSTTPLSVSAGSHLITFKGLNTLGDRTSFIDNVTIS